MVVQQHHDSGSVLDIVGKAGDFDGHHGDDAHLDAGEVHDAACWREIRDHTGYDNYKTYLRGQANAYGTDGKTLHRIRDYCVRDSVGMISETSGICTIIDIPKNGSVASSRVVGEGSWEKQSTHILQILRSPPADTCARTVILDVVMKNELFEIPMGLLNAIGLGLQTSALTMEAHFESNLSRRQCLAKQWREANFAAMERTTITVARKYLPDQTECPPVVLILDPPESLFWRRRPLGVSQLNTTIEPRWSDLYLELLTQYLGTFTGTSIDHDAGISSAIMPILDLMSEEFQKKHAQNNLSFSENIWAQQTYDPEIKRRAIKRQNTTFEQSLDSLTRLLKFNGVSKFMVDEPFCSIYDEAQALLKESQNLEFHLRDEFQLQVGSLSLQESKRSIELSNIQIEESKRGTLVSHRHKDSRS